MVRTRAVVGSPAYSDALERVGIRKGMTMSRRISDGWVLSDGRRPHRGHATGRRRVPDDHGRGTPSLCPATRRSRGTPNCRGSSRSASSARCWCWPWPACSPRAGIFSDKAAPRRDARPDQRGGAGPRSPDRYGNARDRRFDADPLPTLTDRRSRPHWRNSA